MLNDIKKDSQNRMAKSVEAFRHDLTKIRTGRASAALVDHLKVSYHGSDMPLNQVASVQVTDARISANDLQRIVELGKTILQHPVELLPDVRDAVLAIAAEHPVVLITKGDLFHQEAKLQQSGLRSLFPRIEIVSEKNAATYARVLDECGADPTRFLMIGNSLRSDALPVLELGGWAIHTPYHVTWQHEVVDAPTGAMGKRLRVVDAARRWPLVVQSLCHGDAACVDA